MSRNPRRRTNPADTSCDRCDGPRERPTSIYCRACQRALARDYASRRRAARSEREVEWDRRAHTMSSKIRRWGLRPARCQACGGGRDGRRLCVYPANDTDRRIDRWLAVVLHQRCRMFGRHAEAIDLLDLDHGDPGPWFEPIPEGADHARR